MSNLFGSGQPKIIPEFTGLQVNTAVQVLPVPIIYGSPRVDINLIYYNGFNVQQVSQSSGKGILSGGKGAKETEYFATLILAIGEGPIGPPQIIYQDQEVWLPSTYPTNGTNYFSGTATQTPWSYVEATWPEDARSYKNTAYYGFPNAQLDASATVPQINLVISGFFTGSSPLNFSYITVTTGQYDQKGNPISFIGTITLGDADADPGLVIYDFLTNSDYGAGFPANLIDTSTLFTQPSGFNPNVGDQSVSTFCQAVGLAWSVVLNNVESAGSILDRWCKNLNTAIVWNGSTLRFVPYWDEYASGNPGWDSANGIALKYFNPQQTPIVRIPLDQIIQSQSKDEDPITFSRKDPWEVYNTVRLDFKDRTNFFNDNPVEAKDEALCEQFGPRVDNIAQADEFSLQTYANVSVQMQLRRNIAIRRTYTWQMGPLWAWLDPMDVVLIPDPVNYNKTILVRITGAEDDEDENVTFMAEEYPVGSQSPSILPMSPTTPPNQGAVNSPPSSIYAPVMFCPPSAMLTATGYGSPQWIFGCSGGFDDVLDTNWGGVNVWVSLDNVSYERLGTLTGPATVGALTQPLVSFAGVNPDTLHTLVVDLSESDGVLASVSSSAAAAGNTLCVLQDDSGFELLSYTTATMLGPDTYALTGLYRGLYGTTPRFFGAGSRFMLTGPNANILETTLFPAYIGKTFYVKGQSFNVFNNATQDLDSVKAYVFTAYGPTPPPLVPPLAMASATYRRLNVPASVKVPRRRK